MTNSIVVIICYFGEFPWYFGFFAHSCSYNQDIDFLIFTDQIDYPKHLPPNIKLVKSNLEEISELASRKIGMKIDIKKPYKLCDFKPCYGLLFEQYVKDYTFWGHGDIDIIFGNIRAFLTDDVLFNHDLISVRHEYITGYFALYRNNSFMNLLFKKSKDYKLIFSKSEYCSLDECSNLCMPLIDGIPFGDLKADYESMTHIVREHPDGLKVRSYFEFHVAEGLPGNLKWEEGTLTYKKKFEVILYHLIDFKKHNFLIEPNWESIPGKFFINSSSITKNRIKPLKIRLDLKSSY